jgi:hypothetical protein
MKTQQGESQRNYYWRQMPPLNMFVCSRVHTMSIVRCCKEEIYRMHSTVSFTLSRLQVEAGHNQFICLRCAEGMSFLKIINFLGPGKVMAPLLGVDRLARNNVKSSTDCRTKVMKIKGSTTELFRLDLSIV